MGNVELFELCETIPKMQLDLLSIPKYVINKERPHGCRHGKTEEQKVHQDRF